MAIIAKETGTSYPPAPAGLHQGVCCDVIDMGLVENTFKAGTKQHKIRVAWQVDAIDDTGRPYLAQRRYTLSLDKKANLRKDLESWRGRPFTSEELKGFDLEKLIGVNCQLNIMHVTKDGSTYANVIGIVPLGNRTEKIAVSKDYVRMKDRQPPDDPFGDDDAPPF
jgi:hypothetical protein